MRGRALLVAMVIAAPAGPAAASRAPDGYSCTVQAFSNIGAIHGVGFGEVSVSADAGYRPMSVRFRYVVRDRLGGFGRMEAIWDLPDGKPEAMGSIQSLWLPFHGRVAVMPSTIALTLDEAAAAGGPVQLSATKWVDLGADGRPNGIRGLAKDGPLLELRGHRSFGYQVTGSDGARLVADFFLLPDWKKVRGAIRSAAGKARSKMRRKKCDPFYVIGR